MPAIPTLVELTVILAALRYPLRRLRSASSGVVRGRPAGERVLIVGTSPLAHRLIRQIESQPRSRYAIVGVAGGEADPDGLPARYPLLGPLGRLDKIIEEVRPDRIVVALTERRGQLPVRELLEARICRGVAVEDGVEAYEHLAGKLAIESLVPSSLLFARSFRKSRWVLTAERAVSLLASVIGLVALAPLLAVIALAIKLDSPGPVFFVQERVGLRGKRFKLIKFRTMRPASGATSEWVRDNGDRITRVGRWLRRFRLDELPQFVNILQGDMNLVGPRPHPVSNFELFLANIPYYSLRAAVRPGLTGWAQVRYGYANDLDEETEKMRYDLYYIKRMSLRLDFRILFDTVKIVLLGRDSQATNGHPLDLSGRSTLRGEAAPQKAA
jgi:exopolysaccharide biosynthesis polyprenyl glycosylphosphotransferase